MNKLTQTALSICLYLLVFSGGFSQTPSFITDSLDAYVLRSLERWKVPGIAIAIVKDGQVVLEKGWGTTEVGKNTPVDANTLFMIGSNTKAFTGTLMAMTEQDGSCSLSDRVRKWVPQFSMKDPWVASEMRLDDLLCHRMGFETFQGDFMTFDSDLTPDGLMERFAKLTPVYRYRTTWGYCNFGFSVAGEALHKITGKTWADNLRNRIFKPLGMNRSLALSAEIPSATNRAVAHTLVNGNLVSIPYMVNTSAEPCASISSSAHDLTHWVSTLLDSGKYEGRQVIAWEAIARTREPFSVVGRSFHRYNNTHYELYGLGWFLQDYEGTELVMHDGGINGFITSVTLVPEQNLGLVILTNTDANGLPFALRWEILDAYLGLPYRDYSSASAGRNEKAMEAEKQRVDELRAKAKSASAPPLPLKAYAGTYESEVYGKATLRQEGDKLALSVEHHPGLTGWLSYLGDNEFLCEWNTEMMGVHPFPFAIKGKKVTGFTLKVNDFVEGTSYNFVKK